MSLSDMFACIEALLIFLYSLPQAGDSRIDIFNQGKDISQFSCDFAQRPNSVMGAPLLRRLCLIHTMLKWNNTPFASLDVMSSTRYKEGKISS